MAARVGSPQRPHGDASKRLFSFFFFQKKTEWALSRVAHGPGRHHRRLPNLGTVL